MRRLLLATAVTVTAAAVMAQVKLVGHRGSAYGVESTAEAFRNAARMGADYVETDIKVTADGHFVLSHDDTLRRMGSMRVIPESTLAELQADTLRQTRNGVEYTGRLMELGEWLDLCHELGVRPLIEFKYGTGVNNNDQSNIPALIEIVRQKGFEHDCIILTSMKKCLEFVRANHTVPYRAVRAKSLRMVCRARFWCRRSPSICRQRRYRALSQPRIARQRLDRRRPRHRRTSQSRRHRLHHHQRHYPPTARQPLIL